MSVVDEIRVRGGLRMIPEAVCRRHRIGADRVLNVLLAAAELVDHRATVYASLATLVDRTGVNRRDVQTTLVVLVEGGLLVPAGRRGRNNAYLLDVDHWPNPSSGDARIELSGEPSGEPSGELSGELSGDARTKGKGSEHKGRARDAEPDTPMPGVITHAPRPCSKHPNGWHHKEPCGRCASLREYDAQQRAARDPVHAQPVHHAEPRHHADPALVDAEVAKVRDRLAALKDNGRASGAAQEEKDPPVDPDLAAWIDQQTTGLRELHDNRVKRSAG